MTSYLLVYPSEIKRDLILSFDDDGEECYTIDHRHSLKDILRHVLKEAGGYTDELIWMAKEVADEASKPD